MTTSLDIARIELATAFEKTPAATVGLWLRTLPALSEPDAREIWLSRMRAATATAMAAARDAWRYSPDARLDWQRVLQALDVHGRIIAEALDAHDHVAAAEVIGSAA